MIASLPVLVPVSVPGKLGLQIAGLLARPCSRCQEPQATPEFVERSRGYGVDTMTIACDAYASYYCLAPAIDRLPVVPALSFLSFFSN